MEKYKNTIKQSLGIVLCVVMLLSSVSCGKSNDTSVSKTGDAQIRIAHSADKILQDKEYEDTAFLSEFSLQCVRNEYESGQLILTALNDVDEYNITIGTFSNGNDEIPKGVFEVYHEYYHEVESIYDEESDLSPGMYPDALLPLDTAVAKGMNVVKQGENQGIWIAVKVPKEQEAGMYTGSFEVTVNNKTMEIPATIEVLDYTLTDKVHLQSCIPIQIEYMFNGELDDTQEMYEKHLDLLNRFRLSGQYLSSYLPTGDDDAYETAAYEANIALKYHEKESCSSYAIRVIASDDPTYGLILNENRFVSYLKAYIDVSVENQTNLFEKAYVYMGNICDEPEIQGTEARAQFAAQQFDNCINQAVSYLNTLSCDGELKKAMLEDISNLSNVVTGSYTEALSMVQTYCPTVDYYGSGVAEVDYKELRNIGKDYWFYSCNLPKIPYATLHIDDNAVPSRVLGWMAKDYDVSGYLNWELVYYLKHSNNQSVQIFGQECYDDVHRWDDACGDGFYVYPGKLFGLDEPVVSLRLFTICDGFEDYEILLDLENSYQAISEKAGINNLSADSVTDVLYSSLYRNGRIYCSSSQLAQTREVLAQLLHMVKKYEVAIEKVSVEGASVELSLVAPKGTELTVLNQTLAATEVFGEYERFQTSLDMANEEKASIDIGVGDMALTLLLGNKLTLVEDFEATNSLQVTGTKVVPVAEEKDGASIATVNLSGADSYNVLYTVKKNTITKKTQGLNLVIYNNGNQREKMDIYFNGQIVLDSVYVEPGKNVYHYSKISNMNWATLKTVNNIVFKFEGDTSRTQSISFDSLSVFTE